MNHVVFIILIVFGLYVNRSQITIQSVSLIIMGTVIGLWVALLIDDYVI